MVAIFVAASLAILVTPGPTNTLLAVSGASIGFRRGIFMPFAEAIGYAFAISSYVIFYRYINGNHAAIFLVKISSSIWMIQNSFVLWRFKHNIYSKNTSMSFIRIMFTTILNPKAMFIGLFLIPVDGISKSSIFVLIYVSMSILVGMGWVWLGSCISFISMSYAYKAASIILGVFSVAAAASAFSP